jgi:hypothetical protein
MSKQLLTSALAAFACAAVVGAQAPPPQQVPAPNAPPAAAPTQRPPDQKSSSAANLTVTGCLERRPASIATPGSAGAPAANDASSTFVLTKVMRPVGTSGSSSAASAAASYRLDADASKLSSHVGEKVEITGMLASRSDNSSANRAAGGDAKVAAADGAQAKGADADAPQLKVDSVKMIANTCTE